MYVRSIVPADHSGAYYCGEPEAKCGLDIVDPDLVNCPHCQLAPMVAAPVPVKKGDKEDPVRPGPGHLMLMGHALIFGAAGATVKLFSSEQSEGACLFCCFSQVLSQVSALIFNFKFTLERSGPRGEKESKGLEKGLMTCAIGFRV